MNSNMFASNAQTRESSPMGVGQQDPRSLGEFPDRLGTSRIITEGPGQAIDLDDIVGTNTIAGR